jgi:hypothetical protein
MATRAVHTRRRQGRTTCLLLADQVKTCRRLPIPSIHRKPPTCVRRKWGSHPLPLRVLWSQICQTSALPTSLLQPQRLKYMSPAVLRCMGLRRPFKIWSALHLPGWSDSANRYLGLCHTDLGTPNQPIAIIVSLRPSLWLPGHATPAINSGAQLP